MEQAKVYRSARPAEAAVGALLDAIGAAPEALSGALVAVKLDFGAQAAEAPAPALVRALCDALRARGASPFLTDCGAPEGNALEALTAAARLGYTQETVGAPCVLADGVRGEDYDLIPMRGGKFLRSCRVGRALTDADCIVSLTVAQAGSGFGYRGVLHALGFGGSARPGKIEVQSTGQPVVDEAACIGCGKCTTVCEHGGARIDPETGKAFIFKLRCAGCVRCKNVCPVGAIHPDFQMADDKIRCKITEVAKALCDHRAHFHLALADGALLASADPAALDAACADRLLAGDPDAETDCRAGIAHAAAIGLGSAKYAWVEL